MGTKHYDKSFKEQAVRLSEKRGSLSAQTRDWEHLATFIDLFDRKVVGY